MSTEQPPCPSKVGWGDFQPNWDGSDYLPHDTCQEMGCPTCGECIPTTQPWCQDPQTKLIYCSMTCAGSAGLTKVTHHTPDYRQGCEMALLDGRWQSAR